MIFKSQREWSISNIHEFLEEFDLFDLYEKTYGDKFSFENYPEDDFEVVEELLDLTDGYFLAIQLQTEDGIMYFEIQEFDLEYFVCRKTFNTNKEK